MSFDYLMGYTMSVSMCMQNFITLFHQFRSLFQNLELGKASTNEKCHFAISWARSCYVPHRRGGGHIVFGANPVGIGVCVGVVVGVSVSVGVGVILSCLHDISWTGWWILTKIACMQHWDMMKTWLGFGDFDLIFKVTTELKLPKLSPKVFVCPISHELVGRFQPDLKGYNFGIWWKADLILVTLTYFSRSVGDLNCQIWAKRCLCEPAGEF